MFFALTGQTKDSPPEVPKSVTSSAGIEVLYDDFSVKQRQWSIPRFSLHRSPSLEAAFGKAEETVQDQAHALRQQEEEESEGPGRAMLKPSVLDLNSPTIGEQKDRSPRWETPAPKAGESYRLPVLDVDSFRGSSEGGPQLLASSRRICNPESPRHQPIQEVLPVADIQKPGGHQHQEEGSHKPGTYSMDLDPKTAKRHILGASSAPQEALITENPPQQSGITEPISSPSQKAFWETGGKEGSGSRGRGAEELPDHWGTAPWPSVLDQKQNQNWAQFPEPLSQSSAASVPQDWKKGADQRGSSLLPPLQPESQRQGDTLDSWSLHQRPLAGGEPSAERHTQPHRRDSARAKPGSVSWKPAPPESPLEGPLARARSRSRHTEEQLKQCVSRAPEEGKDTDTLVPETDSQYGTWDTGLRTEDSLTPASPTAESSLSASLRRHTPSSPLDLATPSDPDVTDGLSLSLSTPGEQEELSFPEPAASLLDCSAMKARAQLSRKSRRSLPSRPARRCPLPAGAERLGPLPEDWLYRDSTEHKPDPPQEDSDTEDPVNTARRVERSPAPQPQRVPLFPGMDPSALKAQLRKRTDSDSQADTPSPTQLSRSPKSPFVPGTRVRPPSGRKENGSEESSPQWLKELKSKKRLSQYDNDA
uniref:Tankyrase 1-binding protein C-terminal domain-containing protein n=1 Tax=Lepisosteus oculatus TaxID=7918 RepID=W5M532_LEPOC